MLSISNATFVDASSITFPGTMDAFIEAYDTFARAADTGALKVVITPGAPT